MQEQYLQHDGQCALQILAATYWGPVDRYRCAGQDYLQVKQISHDVTVASEAGIYSTAQPPLSPVKTLRIARRETRTLVNRRFGQSSICAARLQYYRSGSCEALGADE
jgi:hypothetical protein